VGCIRFVSALLYSQLFPADYLLYGLFQTDFSLPAGSLPRSSDIQSLLLEQCLTLVGTEIYSLFYCGQFPEQSAFHSDLARSLFTNLPIISNANFLNMFSSHQ